MSEQPFKNIQLYATGAVTLFVWTLLIWTHYHGGVPSHHILQREDLPAISNWWGGLLLPLLTGISVFRIQRRFRKQDLIASKLKLARQNILISFLGAWVFGVVLSTCFTLGYTEFIDYMVDSLLILFFLVPIFRSEYILGFTLGMTITFGAILPTAVALIVASFSAIIYNFLRPLLLRLVAWVKENASPPK